MRKIISPLSIEVGYSRKKNKPNMFILNLNNYRNTFFRTLNNAKIKYKKYMAEQIEQLPKFEKIGIIYKVHKGDARRYDIGNILAVHQKFFEDALVELDHLPDDKSSMIPIVVYENGAIDRENPKVVIQIYDLTNRSDKALYKKDITKFIGDL